MHPTIEEIKNTVPLEYSTFEVREIHLAGPDMSFSFAKPIRDFITSFYTSPKAKRVIFAVVMSASALDGFWTAYPLDRSQAKIVISEFSNPNLWNDNIVKYQTSENRNRVLFLGSFGGPSPDESLNFKPHENTYYSASGSANLPVSKSPYDSRYSG